MTREFYAICQFYEPFTMGGNVWQWRRFKVAGRPTELLRKIQGFAFYDNQSKLWKVHEQNTGGLLGEGADRTAAIHEANKNIEVTPDLEQQMEKLGDTSVFQEVDAAEALRRIAKGTDRKRERADEDNFSHEALKNLRSINLTDKPPEVSHD